MKKQLYRSKKNRIISGLLGGIGEYFVVDPVWIRLAFVAVALFTDVWPAVLCYAIGYFIVPEAPDVEVISVETPEGS